MAKKIKKKGTSRMGGGGAPSQSAMMAQVQRMQQDMVKAQEELANEIIDVTAGGGAITITISGHQRVQAIKIDKDSIDLEDEEWLEDLQDLLIAAVNQAIEQSQAMSAERMEGITGDLGGMLPGGLEGLL
jgi:hypothetical protein